MSQYQLPPLKNEKLFEEFVCDLLNEIENTNDYQNTDFQIFGVKGQSQKGIDILSPRTKTVIQCKVKDLRKKEDLIRKNLLQDIAADLESALKLDFEFDRFILASTFRDDAVIQEQLASLQKQMGTSVHLYYWGWDTLSKYAEQNDQVIRKYFPNFLPKPPKAPKKPVIDLPDGALGKDLLKKNYINYLIKRYGEWKQMELDRSNEKFNWASFNKHLMNQYKAAGINYIHVVHFEDLKDYLQGRIDKTIFGKKRKSDGYRNYSPYEDHIQGILD
jgi:hypothetical protein